MAGSQNRSSSIRGRATALPSHTRGGSRMRESRTYGSVRGACDETHVPTATDAPRFHHIARRRGGCVPARGAGAAAACRSTGSAMKGVAEWLASIGLSDYAQAFANNAIDLSVVRDLTEQDLKDLGILLGHRRKIWRAIAELDGVAPAPTETATEPVLREEAERRHLTVMICDLVGSTVLAAPLHQEDMGAVNHAYY